jgi:hypothetical protein
MRRAILLAALLAAPGCGPPMAREPVGAGLPPGVPASGASGPAGDPHPVLREALTSGQPPLQAYAAETYLETGGPAPQGELQALAAGGNPRVRMVAVTVLGAGRRPDLVPQFRQRQRDDDPAVRLAAAFALAMAGDTSQVTALRDALAGPDVTLRRTACWLLGLMGNQSAKGLLEVKLGDPDALVVLRAAEALHRLGSEAGLDRVRRLTEHRSHEVRRVAARLLGRIGSTADVPRLERLAQSQVFLDVKFAAIGSLARLGEFKRVSLLVEMLTGPDASARVLAARELGETGYEPALGPLGRLMARGDLAERTSAAGSILRIQALRQSWRTRALKEGAGTRGKAQ